MKIIKLTYNEILKQTKKLSFKICFLILILLAIGVPFLVNWLTSDGDGMGMFFKGDINEYKSAMVESPLTDQDNLVNDLNNALIDLTESALKNDPKSSSFHTYLYDNLFNDVKLSIVFNYMIEDKDVDYSKIDEQFDLTSSDFKNMNKTNLKELVLEYDESINEMKQVALDDDYSWYLEEQINALKMVGGSDKYSNEKIKVYEKLIDLGVKSDKDYRAVEGESIVSNYDLIGEPVSLKQFNSQKSNMSYKEYTHLIDIQNKDLNNKIDISWYAINNNVNYNGDGAKDHMNSAVKDNGIFLSIIVIVIAGGIVANEFQRGTIRLLVIRPNKRWKLLLSKFLALMALTVGLALSAYVLSFVGNGLVYGFSDYFLPDLTIVSNKITEVSFLLNSLIGMFIQLIPIVFMGLIALFLSTVINNTAFSVGFSIFLFMGYSLMLLVLQAINVPFMDLTFLPYFDYSQFLNPVEMIENCTSYGIYYTFAKANIVLICWSIVLYGVANFVFMKKDIKN